MKRKIFKFLIFLFGYERKIKIQDRFHIERGMDEINMSDFITANFEQQSLVSVKFENGELGNVQIGHYVKFFNKKFKLWF